jgi:hypothetical protein
MFDIINSIVFIVSFILKSVYLYIAPKQFGYCDMNTTLILILLFYLTKN